jgi:hypothetical protein
MLLHSTTDPDRCWRCGTLASAIFRRLSRCIVKLNPRNLRAQGLATALFSVLTRILNRQGRTTATGLPFTANRVASLRTHWEIPCFYGLC